MARMRLRESETRASRLPELCMKCGAPADTTIKKPFSWCPPWVGVTILLGLLPYIIIAVILTKRMTVDVPVCDRHRGTFWKRTALIWLTVLGWLGLVFLSFVLGMALEPKAGPGQGGGAFMGFTCLTFILGLIAAIVVIWFIQNSGIRPKEITDTDITLIGVDDAFADELDKIRDDRRRGRDDDDYEDRRLPRRRPEPLDVEPADENFREPRGGSVREPRGDSYRERRDDDRLRRPREEDE